MRRRQLINGRDECPPPFLAFQEFGRGRHQLAHGDLVDGAVRGQIRLRSVPEGNKMEQRWIES